MRGCRRTRTQIRHSLMGLPLTEEETQQMQTHLAVCPQCRQIYEQHQRIDAVLYTVFEPYRAQQEEIIARLTQRLYAVKTEEMVLSIPWWRAYRRVLVPAMIILCVLLGIFLNLLYKPFSQKMVIKEIRGSGVFSLVSGSTQWVQVHEGTRLPLDSQLATNQWSQVELQAGLGSHIWINRNTNIQISENLPLALSIEKGELFIEQLRLKTISQIKTPAGIVTPIGTSYDIRVAKNGDTQVSVIAGKVELANIIGTVTIPVGYQSEAGVKQLTPPSTPTQIDIAAIKEWVDKFKRATQYSKKTREKLAQDATILGKKYYNEQRYYDSLTAYRNVAELVPDRATGYSGMGIAYVELKQYNDAMTVCYQALALDSTLSNARYYLVASLVELGRYTEAKPHAELLVKQVPTDHAFSIILAEIYRHLGKLDEAERWYRYGLTQSPCDICTQIANKGLEDIARKRTVRNTSPP